MFLSQRRDYHWIAAILLLILPPLLQRMLRPVLPSRPLHATVARRVREGSMIDINARDFVLGVVGAGAMGSGIAQVALTGGLAVRLTDAS
jgi:phosphoglycerate dehydrogenase-like enzyme